MKDELLKEYTELKEKHKKLLAFLARVEECSSPVHDDYPVGEIYMQESAMRDYLAALRGRLFYEGVEIDDDDE